MKITLPFDFEPRYYQLELYKALDSGKKRAVIVWSRRAGKDKCCFNYMVKKAFEKVGNYFYCFDEFSHGRRVIWEGIQDGKRIIDHIPPAIIKNLNNQEMRIELVNGSIIRIVGVDDYDKIVGTNPIGLVFSEYQGCDPAAWSYMSPIVAQNNGWAIFNGTPRGRNHLYDMYSAALKNPDTWYCSRIQSTHPELPDYYPIKNDSIEDTIRMIEEERQVQTEEHIAQEFGASFTATVEGTYYSVSINKAYKEGRISDFPHDANKSVDVFLDLGKNDDTTMWFRQTSGGLLIMFDYFEANGKSLREYVEVLIAKNYVYRYIVLPHDGNHANLQTMQTNKQFFQTLLREAGINATVMTAPKVHRKIDAIQAVRQRFSRYCFDKNRCSDGILKLSNYRKVWDKSKQVFLDTPVHDWTSHAADALTTEALSEKLQDDLYMRSLTGGSSVAKTDFNPFDRR